jgi:hypothetical protein
MVVIARLDRRCSDRSATGARRADIVVAQVIVDDTQKIPLDFRSDDAAQAALGEFAQQFAQKHARRKVERPAVVEIFIAENPADARRPRQDAKGRGIGHEGEIGRARHLVEPHAAAARERGKNPRAGGIERRGGDADIVAAGQGRDEGG